ncbi:hypothetical protein FKG94_03045 [Exilibacterium tricleocarpae]|uniref:Tetratricopeptide repeat protein n=1 Tax=Exilibacterium tricleocarpae TaxID=2591008 RepID=A0A545U6T0_9GAMM|nr:hypothetical protein [Exilibacterium tricleocarpae]TQV85180.1 hypothetical protein FKG94_03045 [Exilibacterium tricleocarpae]
MILIQKQPTIDGLKHIESLKGLSFMTYSSWVSAFQWVGLIGAICALISFVGIWYCGNKASAEQQRKILVLERSTDILAQFGEIAMLGMHGSEYAIPSVIKVSTPLTQSLEGTYDVLDGRLQYRNTDESLEILLNSARQFPDFPFSHYAIAYILYQRDDASWREHAEKSLEILEKTTTIPNHNPDHDKILAELKSELK